MTRAPSIQRHARRRLLATVSLLALLGVAFSYLLALALPRWHTADTP